MMEISILFNYFECYKYLRNGLSAYIKDTVPNDSILVDIAINEAVNNAIKHGKNGNILVKLKILNNNKLLIRVKDQGQGFSVEETLRKVNKTNTTTEIDYSILKESGRGLFIMQQIMDKVIYNRKGNDVLLVKNLQRSDTNQFRG